MSFASQVRATTELTPKIENIYTKFSLFILLWGNVPTTVAMSPQLFILLCGNVPTTVAMSPKLFILLCGNVPTTVYSFMWQCPQFTTHGLFLLLRHLITSHLCFTHDRTRLYDMIS